MKTEIIGNLKISYREETCDKKVIDENLVSDIFFKGVPEYRPKQNDVIIDIGAHIGAFSILAATRVNKNNIFAIEASKDSFEYLKRNIMINNLQNISAFNLALTDHDGNVQLYHDLKNGNWGDTVTRQVSDEYEVVKACTLADFMIGNKIYKCDFMKLNCEGSEFKIILSTPKEYLKKIKIILILYHLDLVDGFSENDLPKYLKKCGFFLTIRNKEDKRGWIIAYKKHLVYRFIINDLRTSVYGFIKKLFSYLKIFINN
ncbi:MAG: FkbM family methyltransferase [Actinomycetota bacterium]